MGKKYDLCISLEVAEHIEEDRADLFIDNLCDASDVILFSAALPKQGGGRHVNEQEITYWAEKFKTRGYTQCDFIRKQIWNDSNVEYWYKQNIAMYVKDSKRIDYLDEFSLGGMSIVHPQSIYTSVSYYQSLLINLLWFKKHMPHLYKLYRKIRT